MISNFLINRIEDGFLCVLLEASVSQRFEKSHFTFPIINSMLNTFIFQVMHLIQQLFYMIMREDFYAKPSPSRRKPALTRIPLSDDQHPYGKHQKGQSYTQWLWLKCLNLLDLLKKYKIQKKGTPMYYSSVDNLERQSCLNRSRDPSFGLSQIPEKKEIISSVVGLFIISFSIRVGTFPS